ncbi:hypothetical protein BGZ59_004976 [Podila verticillata]|nr:hypothetical protein BGZ59_004976 [Podila verticillata]
MDRNKPERPFCSLALKAICAAILVLCSAHKPLEIRVIEGGGRYRPYSGRTRPDLLCLPRRKEGRAGLDGFLIRGSLTTEEIAEFSKQPPREIKAYGSSLDDELEDLQDQVSATVKGGEPRAFGWLFDLLSPRRRCLCELNIWCERSEDLGGLALDLSLKIANDLTKLSNLRQLRKLDFERLLLIKDHQEASFMDLEDAPWMVEH